MPTDNQIALSKAIEMVTQPLGHFIELQFEVQGRPSPNHRPRVFRSRTIKDPVYAAYMERVAAAASRAVFDHDWVKPKRDQMIIMFLRFWWCTKGKPYRVEKGKCAGQVRHSFRKVPDAENLFKAALDGCTGVLFHNDNIIVPLPWPGQWRYIQKVNDRDVQRTRIGIARADHKVAFDLLQKIPGGFE